MLSPTDVAERCAAEFAAGQVSRDAEVAGLRAEILELHAELARRTIAVIVSDGGQALACSASVAATYGTVREERDRLRAEVAEATRVGILALDHRDQAASECDRLRAEVAALKLALENSGTRHEYTAPPGMVFVPDDFLAERDRLRELLREAYWFIPKDAYLSEKIDAALKEGS